MRGALGTDAAGYVAAIEQGFYESAGLDVTLVPGDAEEPLPSDATDSEFLISWVPAVLAAREQDGSDLVDIAQIAQRSGTLSVARRDTGIRTPADLAGQRLGIIAPSADLEIGAATTAAGLGAGDPATVVVGPTVEAFVAGKVPTTQALIYDGYAQILESIDPTTDRRFEPTDLDVINYADHGTAMLQDAIFARASWLADGDHQAVATAFLEASFRGWIYCRDDPTSCVEATRQAASAAASPIGSPDPSAVVSSSALPSVGAPPIPGIGHLAWMLNEYHSLVWPASDGIGIVNPDAWQDTVDVLLDARLLSTVPSDVAYRTDLAMAALAELEDLDTTGAAFQKQSVDITPDGQ